MADNISMSDSINESFNLEQYVVSYMGTRRIWGLPESVAVTIVYSIILVTGVVGNVLTCVVIRKNAYMHTATNFYLFSLATSDILSVVWGKLVFFFVNFCQSQNEAKVKSSVCGIFISEQNYTSASEIVLTGKNQCRLHCHFLTISESLPRGFRICRHA